MRAGYAHSKKRGNTAALEESGFRILDSQDDYDYDGHYDQQPVAMDTDEPEDYTTQDTDGDDDLDPEGGDGM